MSLRSACAAVGVLWMSWILPASAGEEITPANLAGLMARIKPQPGESRWLEIPWFLDLHEARQKAAVEGKPLFVYSGGGATGIGAC